MGELTYPCNYRPTEPRATSWCRRRAARRERGDSKCLGHWAVEWLGESHGGAKLSRRTWTALYGVLTLSALGTAGQLVWDSLNGKAAEHAVLYVALCAAAAGLLGGITAALILEHALGGTFFLVFAPVLSAVALVLGVSRLLDLPPGSTLMSTHVLTTAGILLWSLTAVSIWLNFVMHFRERFRWAVRMNLLAEVAIGGMVLTAVARAITSRGAESESVVYFAVVIGITVVLRGTKRIKDLVRRLRI